MGVHTNGTNSTLRRGGGSGLQRSTLLAIEEMDLASTRCSAKHHRPCGSAVDVDGTADSAYDLAISGPGAADIACTLKRSGSTMSRTSSNSSSGRGSIGPLLDLQPSTLEPVYRSPQAGRQLTMPEQIRTVCETLLLSFSVVHPLSTDPIRMVATALLVLQLLSVMLLSVTPRWHAVGAVLLQFVHVAGLQQSTALLGQLLAAPLIHSAAVGQLSVVVALLLSTGALGSAAHVLGHDLSFRRQLLVQAVAAPLNVWLNAGHVSAQLLAYPPPALAAAGALFERIGSVSLDLASAVGRYPTVVAPVTAACGPQQAASLVVFVQLFVGCALPLYALYWIEWSRKSAFLTSKPGTDALAELQQEQTADVSGNNGRMAAAGEAELAEWYNGSPALGREDQGGDDDDEAPLLESDAPPNPVLQLVLLPLLSACAWLVISASSGLLCPLTA